MKRNLLVLISFLLLSTIFYSCKTDDDNSTENNTLITTADELLLEIATDLPNLLYHVSIGTDMGTTWVQQIAKIQYNEEANYRPRQAIVQFVWDELYDLIEKTDVLYNLAIEEENNNIKGIAILLKSYSFALLTDIYGDIPFNEALTSSSPSYDLQENIYPELFSMLDESINLLNNTDIINPSSDVIYQGDVVKWKKFAKSLKFRFLMRVSGEWNVSNQLQTLIDDAGMFNSNNEEAKYVFSGVSDDKNPIHKFVVEYDRHEFRPNQKIVTALSNSLDPRLEKMVALNLEGNYFGALTEQYNYEEQPSEFGELYLRATAPAYLFSYSELELLIAEAAQKGWISVSAEDHYNAGVTSSFIANELSLELASDFLMSNPFNSGNGLALIGEQKWIALYCQGIEAWTEWRRTGFPNLDPTENAFLNQIPNRLNYPVNESIENSQNYNSAVLSQGEDNLLTELWWQD